MKKALVFSTILIYFACTLVSAQGMIIKNFDFNLLKNKVLYINEFSESSAYAKRLLKKGKYSELKTLKEKMEYHNAIWKEAMAKSSFDAIPYEIKEFDTKKLYKEKNEQAIILSYYGDQYGNDYCYLEITGPKRTAIANALINGLDLSNPNDLRLMMNLLNYSLNEAVEIDSTTGDKTFSGLRNRFKQTMVDFYHDLPQQIFYVVKEVDADKPNKAAEKNKEIEESLKANWNISKYEIISEEDLQKKKDDGVTNGYYWKSFNCYTNSILMVYKFRYLLTIDRDEPVFFYYGLGSGSFKASTVQDLQEKIISKGEKYQKQLEKK